MRHVLGISAFYHDSAAALVRDGVILAAAQEERFTRRKNDEGFPRAAIDYCLRQGRIGVADLDAVAFYEKPIRKFSRALETFLAIAPHGLNSFVTALPGWLAEKLNLRRTIREELELSAGVRLFFTTHHHAHAASAFFPSPFAEAAILTVDGVGEYSTTTISAGKGKQIEPLMELTFPHSLGLLYSAFTAYCGFRVNSGEYKLMGLAPYGEPKFERAILEELVDLKPDGSFWLNMDYFDFLRGRRMTNERFHELFGGPPRQPESKIENRHCDVARSIQNVTEEIMLRLARHAKDLTGLRSLCLAGGVALNCVANGRILREASFDRIWIQPAAGDAGGALGAALAAWHQHLSEDVERKPQLPDSMQGALLGPEFSAEEIRAVLDAYQANYTTHSDDELIDRVASLLAEGKVVGWVQGRMEFGPRALGNRSILADPRLPNVQATLNLKVKKRESFRPFAPAVLEERVGDYFELDRPSPYMLLVAGVNPSLRRTPDADLHGLDRLKLTRSSIPAVTHVDYSARIQTVSKQENSKFYDLIRAFEKRTGCGVVVNTSFNLRGEPIVGTPEDAYRCFLQTDMDYLAIGRFILDRRKQPPMKFATRPALD